MTRIGASRLTLLGLGLAAGFAHRDALATGGSEPSSPCYGLTMLTSADNLVIEKRYTTTSNFTGTAFEQGIDYVCLHPIATAKLKKASRLLEAIHPGYRLVIFDGLRTASQQNTIWNIVRGTNRARYVADPRKGSIHSFGFAVDLSIVDRQEKALDMGTDFDAFTARAEPRRETELLQSGQLTRPQVANRILLRDLMSKAGFQPLSIEWWHFDALPPQVVRSRYRQIP